MNALAPLRVHMPSASTARVLVAPASEPASGSVRPNAGEPATCDKIGQPVLLLLLRSESEDGIDPQADTRLEGDPDRLVDAAELLDRDAQRGEVGAGPAVLLRDDEPEQAELAHRVNGVERETMLPVPSGRVRRDLAVGEVANHLAEHLMVLR